MKGKINIVFGTTASGKTAYTIDLAEKIGGEIINCDAMQVYKEIPILTAQPNLNERKDVPHHLFGYVKCDQAYSVGKWLVDAISVIETVLARGNTPILVGGTGMYIKALVYGINNMPVISKHTQSLIDTISSLGAREIYEKLVELDPRAAETLKPNDTQRILRALAVFLETGESILHFRSKELQPHFTQDKFHLIYLNRKREDIYSRINTRFDVMVENGALAEASALLKQYGMIDFPKAHGLPELIKFIIGDCTIAEAILTAKQITRNYAKRQITWAKHQLQFNEIIEL